MNPRTWVLLSAVVGLSAAEVSPLHPRIYVRHDSASAGKGLRISELRTRLKDPAYARWRSAMPSRGAEMEHALRYLEDGNAGDLASVRDYLTTRTFSFEKNNVGGFLAAAEMATAFDWVYAGLTAEERSKAMANIVTTADSSERFLRRGGPDINHNYTYMALSGIAVTGLVLSGEGEPYGTKARAYLDLARQFLEGPGLILDTWKARQGAWSEGSHYTFHETLRNLVLVLHAYRSATDVDYFPLARAKYGDFIRGAGRFVIGCTRPDMTVIRTGDTAANRVTPWPTLPLTIEMMAAGVEDPDEAARLRSFDDEIFRVHGDKAIYNGLQWGMRIFWDPRARRTPSYKELPLFQRLGAGTYEQIVLRNGFGAGSTHIAIIAGDQFTDHQHFDKGQFLIYHRGGLAIDSGAYDHMYTPDHHSNEYAPRTIAHNCLLVYDPAEVLPKGYTNDGGQLVIRNKQHHRDWPQYLAHRESEGLHGAEVTAWDARDGEYAFLTADLHRAYGPKVTSYTRTFAYLPDADWLVVLDRVTAATPDFEKRWLLHMQDEPTITGARTVVQHGGVLTVDTLLPAGATVRAIGGAGKEFFNAFNGKNYPVSNPAVAAEGREAGAWRIEVSPNQKAASDAFLHSIQIRDAGLAVAPAVLVRGATGAILKSRGHNRAVVFASQVPLQYEVDTNAPAVHLVGGLPGSADVIVEGGGRTITRGRTTAQGVLRFEDSTTGHRTITIRRASH